MSAHEIKMLEKKFSTYENLQEIIIDVGGRFFKRVELESMSTSVLIDMLSANGVNIEFQNPSKRAVKQPEVNPGPGWVAVKDSPPPIGKGFIAGWAESNNARAVEEGDFNAIEWLQWDGKDIYMYLNSSNRNIFNLDDLFTHWLAIS